ncbi:MAG TPA: glycoside hydrolase family 75 protein [Cytophagaceae bacterium]|jgi:hypothetical protein
MTPFFFFLAGLYCISCSFPKGLERTKIVSVEQTPVYQLKNETAFYFMAGLRVDADGSPRAYHPEDRGLDHLENAGRWGNWWALATWPNGVPYLQGESDPHPGFYVSKTSLEDTSIHQFNPSRYVNAEEIPYIVLPEKILRKVNVKLGDFVVVVNTFNKKFSYGLFADVGPPGKLGEASIALTERLGIYANPKDGGIDRGIIYLIFPGTGNGRSRSLEEIDATGKKIFEDWGGLEKALSLY